MCEETETYLEGSKPTFYLEAAPLVADLRAASTLPLMSDTLVEVR